MSDPGRQGPLARPTVQGHPARTWPRHLPGGGALGREPLSAEHPCGDRAVDTQIWSMSRVASQGACHAGGEEFKPQGYFLPQFPGCRRLASSQMFKKYVGPNI